MIVYSTKVKNGTIRLRGQRIIIEDYKVEASEDIGTELVSFHGFVLSPPVDMAKNKDPYTKSSLHLKPGNIQGHRKATDKYLEEALDSIKNSTSRPRQNLDQDIILMPEGLNAPMAHIQHRNSQGVEYFDTTSFRNTESFLRTKRIGLFLATSLNYSGGRLHLYQYALSTVRLGVEVFLFTNRYPSWVKDYPVFDNMHILIDGKDKMPEDLDVIMSDGKGEYGEKGLAWKRKHPRIPLFCLSFETANWVAHYRKEYSNRLGETKGILENADYLLSNSKTGLPYLKEWVRNKNSVIDIVLPPAVNVYALKRAEQGGCAIRLPDHRYAVWSARKADYKGCKEAISSIWDLPFPFDLVVFGAIHGRPKNTSLHKYYDLGGMGDLEKYYVMMNAHMTLAPSTFEGWGMVPAESLSSGTQVVVYKLPVLDEAYGRMKGLHYVKWNDQKAFVKKVRDLAEKKKPKLSTVKIKKSHGMDAMKKIVNKLPCHKMKGLSVTAHMLAYWGFIPESIESIYQYVDQIVIAYGRVSKAKKINDGTYDKLMNFPDPDKKIIIEARDVWHDKTEMREWCAVRTEGNYMVLLDGDEIWTGFDEWLKAGVMFGKPRWVNFWHDNKHWIYDYPNGPSRWGKKLSPYGSTCRHYRCSWWRGSYRFRHHTEVIDMNKTNLNVNHEKYAKKVPGCIIYHLGHALSEKVMACKHAFYIERDGIGDKHNEKSRKTYWKKWNGKTGDCGDGIIAKVKWELPNIVKKAFTNMETVSKGEV